MNPILAHGTTAGDRWVNGGAAGTLRQSVLSRSTEIDRAVLVVDMSEPSVPISFLSDVWASTFGLGRVGVIHARSVRVLELSPKSDFQRRGEELTFPLVRACPGRDLNPYDPFESEGFKPSASANSATRAYLRAPPYFDPSD